MSARQKSILVFSAHAADFVWRAGGAIALYVSRGYKVRVLCLSYGERGESQGAWAKPGMTLDCAKKIRHEEASRAANILGSEIRFFDSGDYPIKLTEDAIHELVVEYRTHEPDLVLTHSFLDPYNPDHSTANEIAIRTRIYAQALGYPANGPAIEAPPVFLFEPHQPEQCDFKPQVLLDITPVYEAKRKAMESMGAQGHLVKYYEDLALRRGVQAVRNSGNRDIRYAEAYQRVYPQVTTDLT